METVPRRLTFGAHADAYERARPAWPDEAARWLVPDRAALVVELGAGTGKLTRAVAALGVRVVAVEPDSRMLAVRSSTEPNARPGTCSGILLTSHTKAFGRRWGLTTSALSNIADKLEQAPQR